MNVPDVDQCLTELETTCDAVLHAVTHSDTTHLQPAVIRQCQLLKQLQGQPLDASAHARLASIAQKASLQQELIRQAMQVSEFYLTRLHESRGFSRIG